MANLVLKDAFVSINSVDLSSHCKSVSITYEAELLDETMMGDGTRGNKPGLLNWSMECEFESDYAAAQVDATLFPLVGADAFPVEVRPTSAARSATNPAYTGNAVLESYKPVGGTVGELAMSNATFKPGGTPPTLTRETA
jgi:hypothetical protein